MLLSRVAEAVYWTGRYLERAESTARVVKVHTELYLDLPKAAGLGWAPLLAVTGSAEPFSERYVEVSEEHVVDFLVCDGDNPGSIVSSLAMTREDMRTTRAIFPREAWEALNRLYLWAGETCDDTVQRRHRLEWMDRVIADCQRLTGLLSGTMSHDDAYSFLRIGKQIERADMTTRVLDVRAGTLMAVPPEQIGPYADVTWMSVLKSLAGYQMYRRKVQSRVKGSEVLRFLLQDPSFPRSVARSLSQISHYLDGLSNHDKAMALCSSAQAAVDGARVRSLAWDGLHDYVDDLQEQFGELHEELARTYFRRDIAVPPIALASA